VPSPTACTRQFSDVPPGSTFYAYIDCIYCLGIVDGYPDGTFRPNHNVTRGQLAKIASNSAGFNDTPTGQQFEDVPPTGPDSTFYVYIYRMVHRGLINGYPCGASPAGPCVPPANLPYFLPNQPATRGQISKIISNAAGFNDTPTGQTFQDVPPSGPGSTFYAYIYRLVIRGIVSGYPCGAPPAGPCVPPGNLPYFLPDAYATRAQASKIDVLTFFPDCNIPARNQTNLPTGATQ
jgi:5'-nucleotidase/2',3'-cyclic-nucleotide 2'-phosphodiesterase/3'-nucleotidase/5'-nucleotidase